MGRYSASEREFGVETYTAGLFGCRGAQKPDTAHVHATGAGLPALAAERALDFAERHACFDHRHAFECLARLATGPTALP